MFGVPYPPPAASRVLELGCSVGTNLIHMANSLPGAEFVGIDLEATQVQVARERAAALGLTNVRFEAADITDFGAAEQPYDYILACGVLSWVPPHVQDRIFQLCADLLTPNGIAYITYNTLPGWYMRLPIRDLMVIGAGEGPAIDRVMRAGSILHFVSRAAESAAAHDARDDHTFASIIKRERDILDSMPGEYVAHEHLERNNHPMYLKDFMEMAARHGLQYLADSTISTMFATELEPDIQAELDRITNSQIGLEQLLDFIRGRQFRQTLLCRADVPIRRNLNELSLSGMFLSVSGEIIGPDDPAFEPGAVKYRSGKSLMRIGDDAFERIIRTLVERSPNQVAFDDLVSGVDPDRRRPFESEVIRMYLRGLVSLDVEPTRVAAIPGDRPRASQAAVVTRSREAVSNLLHEDVILSPVASAVLEIADGTKDREAIATLLRDAAERAEDPGSLGELLKDPGTLHSAVESALAELAEKALLVAAD